jgi:hypothetical protein
MADNLALTVTGPDGTVYAITGTVTGATVVKTSPATPPPVSLEPVIPWIQTVNMLLSKAWSCKHDLGTPGDANGTYTYPATAPDKTANCGLLSFTNIDKGGALYHANVLADATPYNTFCLEVAEFFPVAPLGLSCMENDLEQVGIAKVAGGNASYVDMATQLDHYKGAVDITQNQAWQATSVKIDPSSRKAGVWYTTRIYLKNVDGKNVLYMGIFLSDTGLYYPLNITVPSQPSKLWGEKLLNQQKQFVGLNMGSLASQVYIKTLNIYCGKT